MRSWRDFLFGLVLGAAALAAAVYCYFRFGFAPVSVSAGAMPFERLLVHGALHAKLSGPSTTPSPIDPTEANLLAGARNYRSTCALCHGLPGRNKTDLQSNMYPAPPSLLTGKGVTDDPAGRTHWVVANGIRMTGMPSFEHVFSDTEIWQLSLLLAGAHSLPASVQKLLQEPDSVQVSAR